MVATFAYSLVLGKPLIFYSGIIALFSFLFTASIGFASMHGIKWVPFKYHPWMALTSLTLGTLHGLLGLSVYFNF